MKNDEKNKKVLRPKEVEDLTKIMAESGVFEMLDCTVHVSFPQNTTVAELDKIYHLIHSMINVEDIDFDMVPIKGDRFRIEIESVKADYKTYRNVKRED